MARLAAAVAAKDPAGVLACFSKKRPIWFITDSVDNKTSKLRFTYEAIEKGMKPGGDFRYYFFDDDSEFEQGIEDSQRWPQARSGLFVPPGYEKDPKTAPTGVRWRKEDGAYVIDALFDSGA